mmetsp:Transcript_14320/g.29349  ORF Transcript_14320/g.29349 Transcript_14320/m.29349 type:complete len:570 (-) Transcript_14320:17-1726(-)
MSCIDLRSIEYFRGDSYRDGRLSSFCFRSLTIRYRSGGVQRVGTRICRYRENTLRMVNNVVHWFRKGLRVHDNPALRDAVREVVKGNHEGDTRLLYFVFVMEEKFLQSHVVGAVRMKFMLECLHDLDQTLAKHRCRILFLRGNCMVDTLLRFLQDYQVGALTFERDTEPWAKRIDRRLMKETEKRGVKCFAHWSHTLFPPEQLLDLNEGHAPRTMKSFTTLIESAGEPEAPIEVSLAGIPPYDADVMESREFRIPSLSELGFNESPPHRLFLGGETAAISKLQHFASLENGRRVAHFEKPKTSPCEFDPPSTTTLSPYITFGCLSVRLFYIKIRECQRKFKTFSKPPSSLLAQLYWREHFTLLGYVTKNFDQMKGNELCTQIPWDESAEAMERYRLWEDAKTGFPWIDAAMTQLRQEGFLHHLARHSVACFLTRGDLWVSWEHGKRTFDQYLIDCDWSLNSANWMWLSASAFFRSYFRVYSPVAWPKKWDKEGKYVKYFLPVLRDMPEKYIYEPWLAPLSVQKKAKCIIGKDYPEPIVDHKIESQRNIERMKEACRSPINKRHLSDADS